jgi:hypothetical protein
MQSCFKKKKKMEGVPSTCSVGELPPELHCWLCKEVMKDVVLTKCCFESFYDICILRCLSFKMWLFSAQFGCYIESQL